MTNTPGEQPDPQSGDTPTPDPNAPAPDPQGYWQQQAQDQQGQPGQWAPQPGYGQPGQYGAPPPYGYAAAPPKHPSATTAMVLGIVALAGGLACGGLPLLVAPFAWVTGAKAVREIDASGGQLGGRSEANAGKILGIIGTALAALFVIAVIGFIGLITIGSMSSS